MFTPLKLPTNKKKLTQQQLSNSVEINHLNDLDVLDFNAVMY